MFSWPPDGVCPVQQTEQKTSLGLVKPVLTKGPTKSLVHPSDNASFALRTASQFKNGGGTTRETACGSEMGGGRMGAGYFAGVAAGLGVRSHGAGWGRDPLHPPGVQLSGRVRRHSRP